MSREQGPHEMGMRPAAIGAGRRQRGVHISKCVKEAAT